MFECHPSLKGYNFQTFPSVRISHRFRSDIRVTSARAGWASLSGVCSRTWYHCLDENSDFGRRQRVLEDLSTIL